MFEFKEETNNKKRNLLILVALFIGLLSFGSIIANLMTKEFEVSWISKENQLIVAEVEEVKPEPTPPITKSANPITRNRPLQTTNVLSIMASPKVPSTISTLPQKPSTVGVFTTNRPNVTGSFEVGSGRSDVLVSNNSSSETESPPPVVVTLPPPPPVPKPTIIPTPSRPISGGALQGKVIDKPAPPYPPAAKAGGQQGIVTVYLVVDERGKVASISSVSGPALLQQAARGAAMRARFEPTTLSGVPVKVTGWIKYNFVL